jgi:hypothetical protein
MVKKQTVSRPKTDLVKEIDAAITLLTRVRALAESTVASAGTMQRYPKAALSGKQPKRTLSADAREAIAAAQRKRWAKVRRQKKKTERAAHAQ